MNKLNFLRSYRYNGMVIPASDTQPATVFTRLQIQRKCLRSHRKIVSFYYKAGTILSGGKAIYAVKIWWRQKGSAGLDTLFLWESSDKKLIPWEIVHLSLRRNCFMKYYAVSFSVFVFFYHFSNRSQCGGVACGSSAVLNPAEWNPISTCGCLQTRKVARPHC